MVWTCLPFIRSDQNHLARHSERKKKTKQTEEEVGRQHQGLDRPGVRQVPVGSGEQRKLEETGCEVICGAPTTPAVKGSKVKKNCPPPDKDWPASFASSIKNNKTNAYR